MDSEQPIVNIAGERVALGPLRDEHFDALARWENDYATERFFTEPGPRRPEETRRRFSEGELAGPENVMFALYEVAGWCFIGFAGLLQVNHINRTAELVMLVGPPEARGKGYGTEATRLILDHAFIALGLATVTLRVYAFNPAGIRAYEKAGFKHAGVLRNNRMMGGRLWDTILMDAVAEEFDSPALARRLLAVGS